MGSQVPKCFLMCYTTLLSGAAEHGPETTRWLIARHDVVVTIVIAVAASVAAAKARMTVTTLRAVLVISASSKLPRIGKPEMGPGPLGSSSSLGCVLASPFLRFGLGRSVWGLGLDFWGVKGVRV